MPVGASINVLSGAATMSIPTIRPFLWFGQNAEAAATFYVSIFKNSKIISVMPSPDPTTAMGVEFELDGQRIIAFNGGPHYTLTAAVSLMVHCETQQEVDYFWTALTADGGKEDRCGWLKDRFGLSWQVIPQALTTLMSDKDRTRAGRVVQAMLGMQKIDIAGLQRAYDGV
jgi:predicted 3-demethylubiquinone-9 3-methyltransferase (glyoxalase superfamily)